MAVKGRAGTNRTATTAAIQRRRNSPSTAANLAPVVLPRMPPGTLDGAVRGGVRPPQFYLSWTILLQRIGGRRAFSVPGGPGRINEADVAEYLGKVTQQSIAVRGDLFGQKSQVRGEPGSTFEDIASAAGLTGQRQCLGQPKATHQECSLLPGGTISGAVAVCQPPGVEQMLLNSLGGAKHPGMCRRQETHDGQQQDGGVQFPGASSLRIGIQRIVPSVSLDGIGNGRPGTLPCRNPVGGVQQAREADGPVKGTRPEGLRRNVRMGLLHCITT